MDLLYYCTITLNASVNLRELPTLLPSFPINVVVSCLNY